MVIQKVNVLKGTELYTKENVKMVNFMSHIFYHNNKRKSGKYSYYTHCLEIFYIEEPEKSSKPNCA